MCASGAEEWMEMVSAQFHLSAPDVPAAGALCVPCVKSAAGSSANWFVPLIFASLAQ